MDRELTSHLNGRTAFTLIEVLLAVAIFGIVLAAINTVFYSALRLRNVTTRNIEETAASQHALDLLRKDLRGVLPPGGSLAGAMKSVTASGSFSQAAGIEFYTATAKISDTAPWGDIQKVAYQLAPPTNTAASTGFDLVRTVTRNLLSTTRDEAVQEWLAGNIQHIEFNYFDGTSWVESWDASAGETGLPKAVRVRIQFARENPAPNVLRSVETPIEMVVPLTVQSRTNETDSSEEPR